MEYKAVTNKSLKFKGSVTKTGGIKKKKAQKNGPDSAGDHVDRKNTTDTANAGREDVVLSHPGQIKADTRTPAQRKFDEIRRIREQKDIEKKASMSHRERIESMNTHLSKMTDINDMPKIGPG